MRSTIQLLAVVCSMMSPPAIAGSVSFSSCGTPTLRWSLDEGGDWTRFYPQVWNSQTRRWDVLVLRASSSVGQATVNNAGDSSESEISLALGKFYSVLQCSKGDDVCVTSEAVWAPILACNGLPIYDRLSLIYKPQVMDDDGNVVMTVGGMSESASPSMRILDFNISLAVAEHYTMTQAGEAVDVSKPEWSDPDKASLQESIRLNVYRALSGCRGDLSGTGWERFERPREGC